MTDSSSMEMLRHRIAELEEFLARQVRVQDTLRGSRSSPGIPFFDLLSVELARAAGADIALIGTLMPGQQHIRTVGLAVDGAPAPGFDYALEGTPCENVVGKDVCSYVQGITALFPKDTLLAEMGIEGYCGVPLFDTQRRALGLIVLLTRSPFHETAPAESLLRTAAARASAEIERSQAESRARETDELNRQILFSMKEGICVHDRNLRYLHFNPVMERISGVSACDVIGKHPLEAFPFLKEMGIYADLERALNGETRTSPDLPHRPKGTDKVRWTRTECSPLRDSTGAIVGVIAMIRDITDLKVAEDALRESEHRLSEALMLTRDRVVQLEEQVHTRASFASMVGKSTSMQEVYRRLRLAAESDVTVLLTGESGTGKELAASAIHSLSPRRTGPFVGVNCSAIPEGILESELFGHVKGAFTGATRDKVGLFQAADGGTLFLDEVGDMSPVLQVKVLRALQEREIRRVGDDQPIKVNVRVVTATNRNLSDLIRQGMVREDFYYRIRVFEIRLPPLRERKEDLPLMVDHFVRELTRSTGKEVRSVEAAALKSLLDNPWRGNVRELKNAIEHAFVTVRGSQLRLEDLPVEIRAGASATAAPPKAVDPSERARVLEALHRSDGNRTDAARRLGISRVTLWHRMRTLGIEFADKVGGRKGHGGRKQ